MQKMLENIESGKIDKLVAIKVNRLTRNGYDGYWLLNYCEHYNVKIELSSEPYDVSTADGEMIFGMNLIFGQSERKEIGARTKRGLEEIGKHYGTSDITISPYMVDNKIILPNNNENTSQEQL